MADVRPGAFSRGCVNSIGLGAGDDTTMKVGICANCDAIYQIEANENVLRCQCGGLVIGVTNVGAFRTARFAHQLGSGYFAHAALMEAAQSVDRSHPINWEVVGYTVRKDGTRHTYGFDYHLRDAFENPATIESLEKVWLSGALIALGDALAGHGYFDRAPLLEMVRHLRNGVAHGNRFDLRDPQRLAKHPAHNRDAKIGTLSGHTFEIVSAINGQPVMFDFMEPGDLVDLFYSVEVHLFALATLPEEP